MNASPVGDVDVFLPDELPILRVLPGRTAYGVLRSHLGDGMPHLGCRVAYNVSRGRADDQLEALCGRLTGLCHVREIGAKIIGRLA